MAIPVNEHETRVEWVAATTFLPRLPGMGRAFYLVNRRIINQDRAVIEGQPNPIPLEPGSEVSVYADKLILAYRRLYRRALTEQGDIRAMDRSSVA